MPRIPALPPNTLRLYARLDRFTTECPRCGEILRANLHHIGQVRRAEAKRSRPTTRDPGNPNVQVYNPLTQRLICPQCRRTFVVGLLIYPVEPRAQPEQPYDTQPSWKQLLRERQLTGAFFLDKPIRGAQSVNVVVEGGCQCEVRGALVPTCPVHGWEEQLEPNARTDERVALETELARLREENAELKKGR